MSTDKSKKINLISSESYTASSHYRGEVAKSYLGSRTRSLKWRREQRLMKKIIKNLPKGSSILDLPVGTGRLLPYYAEGNHPVYGIDISNDMLSQARGIHHGMNNIKGLMQGDAEAIPLPDESIDYVICLRLLNLVPLAVLKNIIEEFKRVSRKGIIIQVRVTEKAGRLRMIQKMLTDPRTHLNRLIYSFYAWSKTTLTGKNNKKKPVSSSGDYFIHNSEDVSRILLQKGLIIQKTIEVDKGINFKQKEFIPLLVIICSE
jgi:ubiquinone/menaquinone biosynthesis C-methylase UbiE